MTTDERGLLFQGSPLFKEHWLSYGRSVVAPTAGVIIASVSDIDENTFSSSGEANIPREAVERDPKGFGNYVSIKAEDGRISWLLHLKPGCRLPH